ncbi:uncharacterized protein EI90DRAFT_3118711 [Cantharellus anzutake]|uniref:uncharacterized protein n=1 Tax=Cantharellus anzutake TaxID=1750568 RepID=UPI001908BE2D|nr:uncharacterized protein EI90DRAFT_3118711 [Cantharellus anzutake]KAF8338315.1 hypothetical protein EI90DRAFT_3118711 [Cantharellus anzutake]
MLRKRVRDDEEDGRQPLTPSTTPPGSTHSLSKRRRVAPPNARAAGSPVTAALHPGLDNLHHPLGDQVLSEEDECLDQIELHASRSGSQLSIIDRSTGQRDLQNRFANISPDEFTRERSLSEEEDNYDPEDVDAFEGESSDDDDTFHTFSHSRAKPTFVHRDSSPTSAPLAPINALLHDLHEQRQLVCQQREVTKSAALTTGARLTVETPTSRTPTPPRPAHLTCTKTSTNSESVEAEKATVTARYEETNRLLGALFLNRRRLPNRVDSEDN